jgi:hypothetical protein
VCTFVRVSTSPLPVASTRSMTAQCGGNRAGRRGEGSEERGWAATGRRRKYAQGAGATG